MELICCNKHEEEFEALVRSLPSDWKGVVYSKKYWCGRFKGKLVFSRLSLLEKGEKIVDIIPGAICGLALHQEYLQPFFVRVQFHENNFKLFSQKFNIKGEKNYCSKLHWKYSLDHNRFFCSGGAVFEPTLVDFLYPCGLKRDDSFAHYDGYNWIFDGQELSGEKPSAPVTIRFF